mmetsp:Transcript_61961/g.183053  ORF Transcript_61961/g.183053 Transcript_61961/m.183053 type:complete len:211 (-) Transcript_61961:860-1492(-)
MFAHACDDDLPSFHSVCQEEKESNTRVELKARPTSSGRDQTSLVLCQCLRWGINISPTPVGLFQEFVHFFHVPIAILLVTEKTILHLRPLLHHVVTLRLLLHFILHTCDSYTDIIMKLPDPEGELPPILDSELVWVTPLQPATAIEGAVIKLRHKVVSARLTPEELRHILADHLRGLERREDSRLVIRIDAKTQLNSTPLLRQANGHDMQ